MKNKGVEIVYGNVAVGAKEDFEATTEDKASFVDLSELQYYGLDVKNFANPCEMYQTVLDGTAVAFPSLPKNENFGLWSESISGQDGVFETPIVLNLVSDDFYSSTGLTFTFDTYNQIYATHINIHWWRDAGGEEIDLGQKDFYPDKAQYYCNNSVEKYNRLVITITAINMPQNRLKLKAIDYGFGTIFTGNELRSVKNIQEINPISGEISINTSDFVLDSHSDIEYNFQSKQPLSILFNGELKSTVFVKRAKRKAKRLWEVQAEDYIGLMDSIPYSGGVYNNSLATDILDDIFGVAKVPYEIDEEFSNIIISGYIPYTTCREALMQVAFAIQAVVDTSNSAVVKIYRLDDEVKQNIPLNRIMQGQSFQDDDLVTGVEVMAHKYQPITESVVAFSSIESGISGDNIFVKFSEPLHDLKITNGEIKEFGANYAIISTSGLCELNGQKYNHEKTTKIKYNPVVSSGDIEKIVAIEGATLVSQTNIDNVLEKCYNWLIKTNTINLKIVERKYKDEAETQVGDKIKVGTEYLGTQEGIITKQTFSLIGGIIIKDTVMR